MNDSNQRVASAKNEQHYREKSTVKRNNTCFLTENAHRMRILHFKTFVSLVNYVKCHSTTSWASAIHWRPLENYTVLMESQ